jgi:arginine deiminase
MLEKLACQLFKANSSIDLIFAVLIPAERRSMHLDTIFIMISEDECLVYQPMIMPEGVEQLRVIKIMPRRSESVEVHVQMDEVNSLVKELETAIRTSTGNPDYRLTPIFTGGDNPLYQDREQWCDGANVLAIAPGIVIGYERNHRTFEELGKAGYIVCDADKINERAPDGEPSASCKDIREAMDTSVPGGKYKSNRKRYAIKIRGRELSRARGGPRCMSMPLRRDTISWDRSGKA